MSGGTSLAMRELLFGDVATDRWPERDDMTGEPWRSFIEARRALGAGDREKAIARLRGILEQPDLESRQILQAWHALRLAGESPSEELAKRLEGVVVEVGLDGGLDLLTAYRDPSPPHLKFRGAPAPGSAPRPPRRGRARCGSTSCPRAACTSDRRPISSSPPTDWAARSSPR